MAPAKASASSTFAENPTSSLSSPISLLWAHQLRREHSALLARLEEATAVTKVSTAQLNRIAAQAARTEQKSTEFESKLVELKNDLERAVETGKGLEIKLTRRIDKLEASENSRRDFQKDVRTFEETLRKDLLDRITTLEGRLDNDQDEQDQQVQNMKAEICDLRNRLSDIVNEGVIGVKDSMEQIGEQMGQICPARQHPDTSKILDANRTLARCAPLLNSCGTDNQAPHTSGLVQPNSDQTEDMPTLQPNLNRAIDSSLRVSVDLDEDMITPEPEVGVGDIVAGETMAMLPESPTSLHQKKQLTLLKQGKYESWDRYLLAGESFKSRLPKRKEGAVVEVFVDGIYDEKVKLDCEKILDEAGWSWDGVKAFVEKYIAVEMETQAKQRTESLTHKHKRGEVCPVCSGKSNIAHREETSVATKDSPPRPTEHQAVPLPQAAGPTRRSQRIQQQSRASSVAAVNARKPKASMTRAPKPSKKAQAVTQKPASQYTVPKNVRGKAAETTGLRGETSTGDTKKVITLQYGKQRPDLDGFTKEPPPNRNEENADTALPRNEMTPLQKLRPISAADNLELTTPLNPISNQHSLDLENEYVITSTGAQPGPMPQASRKRKLVDQFEDPLTAQGKGDDLVAQLDQAAEQNKAKEPERKRRRKKKRGVVPPIPRIPILPLSDDD